MSPTLNAKPTFFVIPCKIFWEAVTPPKPRHWCPHWHDVQFHAPSATEVVGYWHCPASLMKRPTLGSLNKLWVVEALLRLKLMTPFFHYAHFSIHHRQQALISTTCVSTFTFVCALARSIFAYMHRSWPLWKVNMLEALVVAVAILSTLMNSTIIDTCLLQWRCTLVSEKKLTTNKVCHRAQHQIWCGSGLRA